MLYLSDPQNMPTICQATELDEGELEAIVGRFAAHSHRAGQLRGKMVYNRHGEPEIRASFGNKLLWRG